MPSSVPVDDDRLWVPVPANIALSRARGWSFEDCRLSHCLIIVIVIIVIIVIIIIIIIIHYHHRRHHYVRFDLIFCRFEHLGATAISALNGSSFVSLVNNTFDDISCSAVSAALSNPHSLHICCTSTAIVSSPALLQVQLGQLDDVNASAADANSDFLFFNNMIVRTTVEYRDCACVHPPFPSSSSSSSTSSSS